MHTRGHKEPEVTQTFTLDDILTGKLTPEVLVALKQAQDAQAEADKKELERKKSAIGDEVDLLISAVEREGFPVQTWHKRKNGEKTDEVSGVGYHVQSVERTVAVDGRLRKVKATLFVKWSPTGGSAPDFEGDES